MNDIGSLSHSKWRCQYHIVFAPKYRRMVIYGKIKADIGKILRTLCDQKGVEIIEAEACPDHIHMQFTSNADIILYVSIFLVNNISSNFSSSQHLENFSLSTDFHSDIIKN